MLISVMIPNPFTIDFAGCIRIMDIFYRINTPVTLVLHNLWVNQIPTKNLL